MAIASNLARRAAALTLLPAFLLVLLTGCTLGQAVTDGDVIEQEPASRTMGMVIDDNTVARLATINIRRAHDDLERANLSVASYHGIVLITGQVPSEDAKQAAEEEALKLKQVRRVYNELEVSGPTSLLTRSGDAWVTGKVKAQLLASEHVRGRHVKVVTENGVTYLMGRVTRLEGEEATEIARNVGGVRQVVRLFEYVD